MTTKEVFDMLRQRCGEDLMCAMAVERLLAKFNLPDPNFGWRELSRNEIISLSRAKKPFVENETEIQ